MRLRFVAAGLILVGLGFAAGMVVPEARAANRGWRCYATDRLAQIDDAAGWYGAKEVTEGLNKVAADAPTGTIITPSYGSGGGVGLTCVKH